MVMGTVEYMAPEQILGEAVDGRADQFALAVVAYQMMTGSTLFGPNTVATLTYKIVHEAPTLPCARNAALPRGVDAVLAKALSKKPADRFATCSEFALALATAFSDAPTAPLPAPTGPVTLARAQTTVALPTSESVPEPSGHSRTPVVAAAIAVLVLGGALAAVIWKPWARTPQPSGPATTAASTSVPPVAPPAAEPKTPAKSAVETTAAVPETEPKIAPQPAKIEPPKPEAKPDPAVPAPTKSVTPPPRVIAPPAAPSPQPVAAPEPVEEMEALALPKEKTPFSQALGRGQQQVKSKDYQGALRSFGAAVELRPESAQARFSRGTMFEHFEQYDAAMRDYTDAIRLDPKLVGAYVGLGNCLARGHRDPEALVEFQRALELKPEAPVALFGRANIYFRRKNYGAALADYDKVVKINPGFAAAYMNRARAREAIGDLAGAAADRRTEQALRK
jgi:Tfp pilus assembly protein PilF